jgi:hypothetical protein
MEKNTFHTDEIGFYVEKHEWHYSETIYSRGWGRGYVTIPMGHPILVKFSLDRWDKHPFGKNVDVEYWAPSQHEHGMYAIGFDTKGKHHTMKEHDEQYVREMTQRFLNWVTTYHWDDARIEVKLYLMGLRQQYEFDKLDAWDKYKQIKSYEE